MKEEIKETSAWRKLTEEEWERIEPLVPIPQRQGKRKIVTDRQMVDILLYKEHTKTPWSKLPVPEEAYMAITKRYSRWRKNGTLERILEELNHMGLLPEETSAEAPVRKKPQKPLEWWELTDEQWEKVAALMPPDQDEKQQTSRYKTNRKILNALLYREYTNLPWREMPKEFGSWRTVYARYAKWKEEGYLDQVFDEMRRLDIISADKYLQLQHSKTDYEENRDWWELDNEQWYQIAHLFPTEDFDKRGKKAKSSRMMLDAILCRYHTKAPWMELPKKYGSWRTVIERYRKWRDDGTLQRVFDALDLLWPVAEEDLLEEPQAASQERETPREWWELTDEQWSQVAGLFLPERGQAQRGKPKTNRQILDVLLYREYTNTPWAELPGEHVSWRTVYDRYTRWKNDGSLERVFSKLKRMGVISDDKYRMGQKSGLDEESIEWWEVTDEQWERLLPLFPTRGPDRRGRKAHSDRQMLNAILCRYHTGTPWLGLPRKYGSWRTIMERYRIWRDDGTLDRVFEAINNQILIHL